MSRMGILRLVDYVSTVSGGGYIAGCMSWLMSVNRNAAEEIYARVQYTSRNDLRFDTSWARFPFNDESAESAGFQSSAHATGHELIAHLRRQGVTKGNPFRRQALRAFGTLFGAIATTLTQTFLYLLVTTIVLLGAAHALAPEIVTWANIPPSPAGGVEPRPIAGLSEPQPTEGELVLAKLTAIARDVTPDMRSPHHARAFAAGVLTTLLVFFIVVAALKLWRGPERWAPGESREDAFERRIMWFTAVLLLSGSVIVPIVNAMTATSRAGTSWLLQPLFFAAGACVAALCLYVMVFALLGTAGLLWSRASRSLWATYLAVSFFGTVCAFFFAAFAALCYAVSQVGPVRLVVPLASWLAGGLLWTDSANALAERFTATRMALPFLRRIVVAALIGFTMVSMGAAAIDNQLFLPGPQFLNALTYSGGSLLVLIVFVNLNRIGLHHFYRDRVLETFMRVEQTGSDGRLHTVVDATEMRLKDLHGNQSDAAGPANSAPYLLINAALNLTGSRDVNRRDRKWSHFLFSKYFCGSQQTGYLETDSYAGGTTQLARALTLSGVSVEADSAYQKFFAPWLLSTLLNTARDSRHGTRSEVLPTGQWIANPRFNSGQRLAFWPNYIWREALGFANERTRLVHVTDASRTGDDIGIYPLLQRRCQVIIACDFESDGSMTFKSLAQVLRDASVDLGIDVDIDLSMITPDAATGLSKSHCAIGRIRYPDCPTRPNWLIYMKSSVTGNESTPVSSYKRAAPDFPHEEAAAQFLDDDQFESYRDLGEHIAEETFARWILDPTVRVGLDLPTVMPPSATRDGIGSIVPALAWEELRIQHSPFRVAGNELFLGLLKELSEIGNLIVSSPSLAWYYPEYLGIPPEPQSRTKRGDPSHIVAMQANLMENAYFSLRLDHYANAHDNRGLMNTFRRWGRSITFKRHFATLRSNHSSEFVAFYSHYIEDWEDIDQYPVPHAWDIGFGMEVGTGHPSALECRRRGAPGLFQDPGRAEVREPVLLSARAPAPGSAREAS
jgi:hypothetical protein